MGDARYRFLNVNARYPGSTHDAFIWTSSVVSTFLEAKQREFNDSEWLYIVLGDSGYPLQPWLMKPYDQPATPNEIAYNIAHKSIRSHIERQIGIWKQRFRILNKERRLHYQPEIAAHIIYSTAVLHNFLINSNFPIENIPGDDDDDDDGDEEDDDDEEDGDDNAGNLFQRGRIIRDWIADSMAGA